MRSILSRSSYEVLQQFAWSKVLLAFDFDGTLAPIVSKPEQATMRSSTRVLLKQLTRLYPCIVISGRSQADTQRKLRGIDLCDVVGNHGVEPWLATRAFKRQAQRWRPLLDERLASMPGVTIEDKVYSVAVHYRLSREKRKARAAILRVARALDDVRVIGGKQVFNILPKDAPHKGMALERERSRYHCDTAIYVGDDETDEDIFSLNQPGQLLTIRVGEKRTSTASFFLRAQRDIDALMKTLLRLRQQAHASTSAHGDKAACR